MLLKMVEILVLLSNILLLVFLKPICQSNHCTKPFADELDKAIREDDFI